MPGKPEIIAVERIRGNARMVRVDGAEDAEDALVIRSNANAREGQSGWFCYYCRDAGCLHVIAVEELYHG